MSSADRRVSETRAAPAPPPVYRPQPMPLVLQTKRIPSQHDTDVSTLLSRAPAVYRPQPEPRVLQTKISRGQPARASILEKSDLPKGPRAVLQRKRAEPKCKLPAQRCALRPSPAAVVQRQPWSPNHSSSAPMAHRAHSPSRAIQRAEQMVVKPVLPITTMKSKIAELSSPEVTENNFFKPARKRTTKEIVDFLFAEFRGLGVGYDLGMSISVGVLGDYPQATPLKANENMREVFGGNCIALAGSFASVLALAGIKAEAREVRQEQPGKAFVVNCPRFIDQQVRGHIYQNNVLWASHYLFTNHAAVWVPDLNTFYDPMAGETYQNLNAFIAIELDSLDKDGNEWTGSYRGAKYVLKRQTDAKPELGNFDRFNMTVVPLGSIATPLGVFKEK
jgi:hypothetical protein